MNVLTYINTFKEVTIHWNLPPISGNNDIIIKFPNISVKKLWINKVLITMFRSFRNDYIQINEDGEKLTLGWAQNFVACGTAFGKKRRAISGLAALLNWHHCTMALSCEIIMPQANTLDFEFVNTSCCWNYVYDKRKWQVW